MQGNAPLRGVTHTHDNSVGQSGRIWRQSLGSNPKSWIVGTIYWWRNWKAHLLAKQEVMGSSPIWYANPRVVIAQYHRNNFVLLRNYRLGIAEQH